MSQPEPEKEKKDELLNEEGKSITYHFPRYQKKSLLTMLVALVLPSAIYASFYVRAPSESGGLVNALTFFGYPWAVFLGTWLEIGYLYLLSFSMLVQAGLILFFYKWKKMEPRRALGMSIFIGMLDVLLIKVIDNLLYLQAQ